MRNMDLIAKQRSLADKIIRDVSALGYDVILAGGAPRDWTFDHPAEDLDIYIGARSTGYAAEALEYAHELSFDEDGLVEIGEQYEDLEYTFKVYEFSVDGQPVQFIFTIKDPRRYVKESFNNSLCKIWYDGKGIVPTWEFSVSKEEKVIVDRGMGHTLEKVLVKPWKWGWCQWPDICMDWPRAFQLISGHRGGVPHPMPEEIVGNNQMNLEGMILDDDVPDVALEDFRAIRDALHRADVRNV